jgi:putative transposase
LHPKKLSTSLVFSGTTLGMDTMRRYTFKLYPTFEQAERLHEQRFMVADLWNALKERCEAVYSREHRQLSYRDMTGEIPAMRHECPEWRTLPAKTAELVAKRLELAYQAFFRRLEAGEGDAGYPRWKGKRHADSIPLGAHYKTGWSFEHCAGCHDRQWRMHLFGTTDQKDKATWIRARGILPDDPNRWRDANIMWRGNRWWLSAVVDIDCERDRGSNPLKIDFDAEEVEDFVRVNGWPEYPPGLTEAKVLGREVARLKKERDTRFPRTLRRPLCYDDKRTLRGMNRSIARFSQKAAFVRRDALHKWTTEIVGRASDLTVIAPELTQRTGKGDAEHWGGNVKDVAAVNRESTALAIGLAIQMLSYKAAEAGIRCDVEAVPSERSQFTAALVWDGRQSRYVARQRKKGESE